MDQPDTANQITFDPVKHIYEIDNRKVPSVTQIIRAAGLMDERFWTAECREFGRMVDDMICMYINGTLDEESLDPGLQEYLYGFSRWIIQCNIKVLGKQIIVYNDLNDYAGTMDLHVQLDGQPWVIDIKTGQAAAWHPLQTAAYAECVPDKCKRAGLYLSDAGYKLIEHQANHDDWATFSAALRLYHWRQRNGLLKGEKI